MKVGISTKFKMKNMKKNILLIPFIAILTLLIAGFASAGLASNIETDFNSVRLDSGVTMVGSVNDVVPVRVTFNAAENASDVKVKVYMEGHRDDVSVSTGRFDIEDDVRYTKLLSLRLPSDCDELSEEYTLYVEVVSRNDRSEEEYTISMQRESYTFKVLSVDYSSRVLAGEVLPVSVVVKNTGYNRMDDTYVVVSIPALGVSIRGYVGDLIPTEEYDDDDYNDGYDEEEDSIEKVVYLKIPANAESDVYDLEVRAYNNDDRISVTKLVNIEGESEEEDSEIEISDDDDETAVSTFVIALTVILVIIFVVLLAVLVVLLTRKDKSASEEVETSYY